MSVRIDHTGGRKRHGPIVIGGERSVPPVGSAQRA